MKSKKISKTHTILEAKMFDEAMKVMNKKLTKSNYPVNIFLLLTYISLQLFLLSSSLLFLSVTRGFSLFVMDGFNFQKNFGILNFQNEISVFLVTEWIFVLNKLSFGSAVYFDFVCLRRDTFVQKIKN